MPKKTLFLVSGLVLVTVILFVIALNSSRTSPIPPPPPPSDSADTGSQTIADNVPAYSVLSISPNQITVRPNQKESVNVTLDTSENEVTAVQLEIAYDPNIVTNLQVKPGVIFNNPAILIDKNTPEEGRYTFAFGITPNGTPFTGNQTAAVITFTSLNKPGERTQLALLPTTLVTARGISNSVLKSASGTLVEVSSR